jgi:hypothetical protein
LTDIRLETENGGTPVDPEYLNGKPWILRNLQQEVDKQRKKNAKQCMRKTAFNARHTAKINVLLTTIQTQIRGCNHGY